MASLGDDIMSAWNLSDLIELIEWLDNGAANERCELEWIAEIKRDPKNLATLRKFCPDSEIVAMWDSYERRKGLDTTPSMRP